MGSNPIWDDHFIILSLLLPLIRKKKKVIPGGTRTPNLLIRSQTPCPIGPQGPGWWAALR